VYFSCHSVTNPHPNPNHADLNYKIRIRWIPILAGSITSLFQIKLGLLVLLIFFCPAALWVLKVKALMNNATATHRTDSNNLLACDCSEENSSNFSLNRMYQILSLLLSNKISSSQWGCHCQPTQFDLHNGHNWVGYVKKKCTKNWHWHYSWHMLSVSFLPWLSTSSLRPSMPAGWSRAFTFARCRRLIGAHATLVYLQVMLVPGLTKVTRMVFCVVRR